MTENAAADRRNAGKRKGCRGCREGRQQQPPMLSPDLVIVARDRNRDPELPAATAERALSGALPGRFARYDLVVLPPADGAAVTIARGLALEFARHDHRVFWLEPEGAPGAVYAGAKPPALRTVPVPPPTAGSEALHAALADLRRDQAIDTAAVLFATPTLQSSATDFRQRWGWRVGRIEAQSSEQPERALIRLITPSGNTGDAAVDLATESSWPARWAALDRRLRAAWPRASIIIVTIDQLPFTRLCLASLLASTEYPNLEVIVVDNGSTDGTPGFLDDLAARHPQVRVILNTENRGFGPANNQGFAAATGELFVLLNNDTMVPPGWLSRLARHLDDPAVGLIGPATNRTCNEAQVDESYQTWADFLAVGRDRAEQWDGHRLPIRMLAMFCTAFRRSLVDEIGPLDERYVLGMFEDEDYALSAKARGYGVFWTPEVYVHHAYHASTGKLVVNGQYLTTFRRNQHAFEYKWGICWERHRAPKQSA